MMKIGVNGFGRIGRLLVRKAAFENRDLELAAINARADSKTLAHLLKYDSVHGIFQAEVDYTDDQLIVNGKPISIFREAEPKNIPWKSAGVDVVVEATGKFKERDKAGGHLEAGAGWVLVAAPSKDPDIMVVYGVNHDQLDPAKHRIVSNASCTTNCLAPVVKTLNDKFGVLKGVMTTIHSYTMSQRILDGSHKDLRRARTAGVSMIPTTTGAAKAVTQVIPELAGKLDGFSIRVPTPNVSMVDFTCNLGAQVDAAEVNAALAEAAAGSLKGIMDYTEEPLVSVDYMSSKFSSVVDGPLTQVLGGDLVKVLAWYDNEFGYASRLMDVSFYLATK